MDIKSVIFQYWQPAVFAFLTTSLFTVLALKFFPKLKMMDWPQRYGLTREPIPYYGGIAIFLAFFLMILIFVPLTKMVIALLVGSALIVLIGFLDDRFNLSPFVRLFFQLVAAAALVFAGVGILSINVPFFGVLVLGKFAAIFTILWVMAIVNTMNFVDGISGLSSGVSFIAGLTIFALSIHPGLHADPGSQVGVATIALIVAFCALAFLIFDFPRAKILMGDTGSTFLGFVIATLAIFSGGKVATAFLVLGIPILDMVWVVLRRIFSGQKFWKGDLKHLHHRLLGAGFSERGVITFYLIITAFFGFSAVSLVSSQQKLFMIIGLVVLMVLLAGALVFLPWKGKGR